MQSKKSSNASIAMRTCSAARVTVTSFDGSLRPSLPRQKYGAQKSDRVHDQVADVAGRRVELVSVVQAGVVRGPDRTALQDQAQQLTSTQGVLRHGAISSRIRTIITTKDRPGRLPSGSRCGPHS
ncbi:MAG: hypothetical protein ABSH35_34555 [Isosphaeraceae bacterium]